MSLEKLYQAVINSGHVAQGQPTTQDALNMAATTLQLSQAYQNMKECEIHEKFHMQSAGGVLLPGEGPLNDKGAN